MHKDFEVKPSNEQSAWLLTLPFAVVLTLQVIGVIVGGTYLWGINLWSIMPRWVLCVAVCGWMVFSIPAVGIFSIDKLVSIFGLVTSKFTRYLLPAGWIVFVVVSLAVVWYCRSQNLSYGDGFSIIDQMTRPISATFSSVHDYIRPLSTLFYSVSSNFLINSLGLGTRDAISIVSVVGGCIGLSGIMAAARSLTNDLIGRLVVFFVTVTGASVLVFLGHIELYVWPSAMLIWTLVCAFRYQETGKGLITLSSLSLLTTLFNGLLAPVVGVILLLSVIEHSTSRIAVLLKRPVVLILALALVSLTGAILCHLLDAPFIVPLVKRSNNPYSAFSLYHLIDWANLLLFLAPAGLILVVTAFCQEFWRRTLTPPGKLLMVVTATCFLVGFWIDPSLGAVRDWDLLSFVGYPLAMWGGWMVVHVARSRRSLKILLAQSFATALFILVPLIRDNINPEASLVRLEQVTWSDVHYSAKYDKAGRCIPWGKTLREYYRRLDLAEKYFMRRVVADPESHSGWFGLGQIALEEDRNIRAEECFARAFALAPNLWRYAEALAVAINANGDPVRARRFLELYHEENP